MQSLNISTGLYNHIIIYSHLSFVFKYLLVLMCPLAKQL